MGAANCKQIRENDSLDCFDKEDMVCWMQKKHKNPHLSKACDALVKDYDDGLTNYGCYAATGEKCAPWGGACANGELISVADREQDNHCGKCNTGYKLEDKTCVPTFGGMCENGELIAIANRQSDNQCGKCDTGYKLVGNVCEEEERADTEESPPPPCVCNGDDSLRGVGSYCKNWDDDGNGAWCWTNKGACGDNQHDSSREGYFYSYCKGQDGADGGSAPNEYNPKHQEHVVLLTG